MSALVFRSIKHVRDAFSESAFNTDTMACPRGENATTAIKKKTS